MDRNIIEYRQRNLHVRRKETLQSQTWKALKMLMITLFIMILALGSAFLISTNKSASKGYLFKQQQIKNSELKAENKDLTTKITTQAAINDILENETLEGMESAEIKTFVSPEDNKIN